MNYTEMLEKLDCVSKTLRGIRDDQGMSCHEGESCKYCMYKVSLNDIIPIENEARICLFHLSNILLSKIRGRIRKSMELNYHLERNQK
jgi:hypothetical protein